MILSKKSTLLTSSLRLLVIAAVSTLSACSAEDDYLDNFRSTRSAGGLPRQDSCEAGEATQCSVTVSQANGILSCYYGTKTCVSENQWGACENGRLTQQIDPTFYTKDGKRRSDFSSKGAQALSSVTDCDALNPCDPNCQYWAEDPEDISNDTTSIPGGTPPGPLEDWSTTTDLCEHELCEVDTPALPRTCHPCVAAVCDSGEPGLADCCDGTEPDSWGSECVDAVYFYCNDNPPPQMPQLCGFSVLADETINIGNATNYPGAIGARQGVYLNANVTSGVLISEANLNLTNASSFGLVYTTGTVTTDAGLTVSQIVAEDGVTMGNNARVGVNGVYTHGDFVSPNAGWAVNGPVTALGNCNVTNGSRIDGQINCGGNLTINSSNFTPGLTHYVGGNVQLQSQSRPPMNLHVGGNFSWNASNSQLLGNLWLGNNITFGNQNNRIEGNLFAGNRALCNHAGGTGVTGDAFLGGTVGGSVVCPTWGSLNQNQSPPALQAPIPPSIGAFPVPPVSLPSVDAFRRDTSSVCALAASRPDPSTGRASHTIYPGVYGDYTLGWNQELTLGAPGSYVFNSFFDRGAASGRNLRFVGDGPWDITVCGKFHLQNGAKMLDDATGAQVEGKKVTIYSAAVRSGGCAPNGGANCCIQSDNATQLSGLLIAPDCDISIGNGTRAQVLAWANNVYTAAAVDIPPIV
ncbi:MAG: hypothetical protein MK135_08010, partial [Polyangiaceae bacterium]|nr:hypothetical protein [Polyangiaceae bacterium]